MKKLKDSTDPGHTYAGQTQAERRAQRYQKFIEAGHELFGTIGFRQTTVRLICKHAKLTDRYFYESFSSLEDVLIDVYQQSINNIIQKIITAIHKNNFKENDVDLLIREALDIFFQNVECPKTARIIWLEVLGVSPRVDLVYNQSICNFASIFTDISLSIYPDIDFDKEEINMIAIGIIGGVSQATQSWLLNNYHHDRQIMVNSMFYIIKGISSQFGKSIK